MAAASIRSGFAAAIWRRSEFIVASAEAEDTERARVEAEQARVRRIELRMFQRLFDFSYRRTAMQAFGWYLVSSIIGVFLSGLVGVVVGLFGTATTFAEGYDSTVLPGQIFGVLYVAALGGILVWYRPKGLINLLLVVFGAAIAAVVGILGGLIPLAVLTTRPTVKL